MRISCLLFLATLLCVGTGCKGGDGKNSDKQDKASAPAIPTPAPPPAVTHGVTIGDVSAERVILWARTDRAAHMHIELLGPDDARNKAQVAVVGERDFTGSAAVTGLQPDTEYQYAVWFADGADRIERPAERPATGVVTGTVRTAPAADQARPVRLGWGGDLAGQNVCRDQKRGFAIFEHMPADRFDLFIALGDMIYADNPCDTPGMYGNQQIPGPGKSTEIGQFWSKWKYARGDARYQKFLASVPTFAVWDDHEVVNDFGPADDTRSEAPYRAGAHLMPDGLRAFLDYNPTPRDPADPLRLYRQVRWGKHLELFFLDTRQYRARNADKDTGEQPKSMLGSAQRAWLERGLAGSDATWKLVISSVPMAIPTGDPNGAARDGWANFRDETGFERELLGILRSMQKAGVNRSVWLTTDVHFATGFRYQPFADAADFQVHEFVSGPLNAGLYPNRDMDETLVPTRLFFHGPETAESVTKYQDALGWMTFGAIDIDAQGALTVTIVDGRGRTVYTTTLQPS